MNLKKKPLLIVLFIVLISCTNDTAIFKDYSCSSSSLDSNLENVLDANNNFSLDIPKHWKTELYIDSESSIFTTADTTKQYNEAYLIKASLVNTELTLDSASTNNLKSYLTNVRTRVVKSITNGTFKKLPAILFLTQSDSSTIRKKTILHLYAPLSKNQYFEIEVHCYGTEAVEKRLCQAIQYVNSLKINGI